MENNLVDKVVVVTGGATGIGYAVGTFFLENNARTIIILDNHEKTGNEAVKTLNKIYGEVKTIFIKCDVTKDLDNVSAEIFKRYKVDVLLVNAGIFKGSLTRDTTDTKNTTAVDWSMRFWNHMRKDSGGSGGTIITVTSIYGFEFDPFCIFYKTSKHAIISFTRTLGHPNTYKRTGVRVFSICPGLNKTNLLSDKIPNHFQGENKKLAEYQQIQTMETVGQATVDLFEIAESGTGWVIGDA